jgi:dolichol-phosphate mannosyltransferase
VSNTPVLPLYALAPTPISLRASVVIPCFNERETVNLLIDRVKAVGIQTEVIVVDDCSTDGTRERLVELHAAGYIDQLILQQQNGGKGRAIRTALAASTGDIVIVQDADLEYDPQDYLALLAPLCDGRAQVVYGSRLLGYEKEFGKGPVRRHPGAYRSAYLGGRLITELANLLYGAHLTDAPTCYKCFRADVIRAITIEHDRFDWEAEVTAKILRSGIEIFEVPISYRPRSFAEGKKIGVRDGLSALWTLARYRAWRPEAGRP